jgi:predicted HTH transcriptional regulator
MLPTLPNDAELSRLTNFPWSESHYLEFKQTLIDSDKLYQCVCAFLNGSGGYLILGIRDYDLHMCGLTESTTIKEIDTFLLKCDNIFHQGFILTTERKRIEPGCVFAEVKYLDSRRRIIVVKIQPTLNVRYMCYDGMQYVRLSASNYKITGEQYYNPDIVRKRVVVNIRENYSSIIQILQNQVKMGASKTSKIQSELSLTTELLFKKILDDKMRAEKELYARSWLWYILCGF